MIELEDIKLKELNKSNNINYIDCYDHHQHLPQ